MSSVEFDYASVVQQLRLAQTVCLTLTGLSLYGEADRMGLSGFLLPMVLICVHLYFVVTRYITRIDGRYDFEGILTNDNMQLKIRYAIQVFAPLVLSVLVHFCTPEVPSISSSSLYNLSHYATIVAASVVTALDVYGGIKKKLA